MIRNFADIAEAFDAGRWHIQPFYKVWPSTFSTGGAWYDGTMAGNFPKASYYTIGDDLTFCLYPPQNHLSMWHGGDVAPAQKIIKSICLHGSANGVSPAHYMLCDFLGFYGGISLETGEVQTLDNTVTLPRYADGNGVRAFLVQLFGTNASHICTLNYINQNGDAKTTETVRGNTLGTGATQNARVANTYLPFIELAAGDRGMRSITDITLTSTGTGIAVLVMVKPLADVICRDTTFIAPYERDFVTDMQKAPVVYDGACINFLISPSATAAGLFTRGWIEYIWN